MKTKSVIKTLVLSLIILIFLNIVIVKVYDYYFYTSLNSIVNNVVTAYPEAEEIVIDTILKKDNNSKILNKYGLNNSNLREIISYKELSIKIVLITSTCFLIIIVIFSVKQIFYNLKIKKEIKNINRYLQEIIKGTYELNIADYNEDELSILKNDIYKVTIKLKELSLYEQQEKTFLMHTLEDISHQLKTPLTALIVTNDILKDNNLTKKEQTEFLNKQTKELEKMEWLITTLLKYSKLDSGTIKLKQEKIKSEVLIDEVLESLSISIELKEINIIKEKLNFDLICDINWTKEAIINIVKNAIDHLDIKGEIIITGEKNPLYTSINIKDNGPGIKKEDIKNIFKRFYSKNTAKNSVGIGLNMAKLIIEKQNGKIEVESELGRYTTFRIIFSKKNY